MSQDASDEKRIASTRNLPRYFVETRAVSMVLLVGVLLWGFFSYLAMPKRKDPDVPVRVAVALVAWPGASSEKIEDLITRKLETKIAENAKIDKIESNTRSGIAVVTISLREEVSDVDKELDDLQLKLASLNPELPSGASPVQFIKDFGDTTNLMLTVASPRVGAVEVQLRARPIEAEIRKVRAAAGSASGKRASLIYAFPATIDHRARARRSLRGARRAIRGRRGHRARSRSRTGAGQGARRARAGAARPLRHRWRRRHASRADPGRRPRPRRSRRGGGLDAPHRGRRLLARQARRGRAHDPDGRIGGPARRRAARSQDRAPLRGGQLSRRGAASRRRAGQAR